MLWLALWLPDLPLAAHACRPLPSAVAERGQLIACDEVALAAGVGPGMRTATARGRLPELAILARDEAREQQLIEELACWTGHFTPEICLAPPAALLMEIGGCLRLFGGSGVIIEQVREGCRQRGLAVRLAAAPTPLAALWLAEGQHGGGAVSDDTIVVPTLEALPEALARLPIEVLGVAAEIEQRLVSFGTRSVGDVLALPRAGLARRLGSEFVLALERALGERPDLRPRFTFPERFAVRLELPGRVEEAGGLAFAARRLLESFCGWLNARQAGSAQCTLLLEHEKHHGAEPSRIELGFASPTRDLERFSRVLRERLERTRLSAPVEAIRLVADSCVALPGRSAGLFASAREGEGIEPLIERLRARLGEAAVHGIATVADHRPECATRHAPVGSSAKLPLVPLVPLVSTPVPTRPLWLLDTPEALPEIAGRPHRRGAALELLTGPERIESGWWDEGHPAASGDVRRDYFVARTPQYECLWVFRDGGGWYLHGLFA